MFNDYHGSDEEYWDDIYYYENYDEEMNPDSWEGTPKSSIGTGFWIWLIILIVVCNIAPALGEAVIFIGLIWWIISKLRH